MSVHGKGNNIVVTWAEEFDAIYRFEHIFEARGFCSGFESGAGKYGAGLAFARCLNDYCGDHIEAHPKEWAEIQEQLKKAGITS